jgi:hypothetical protein
MTWLHLTSIDLIYTGEYNFGQFNTHINLHEAQILIFKHTSSYKNIGKFISHIYHITHTKKEKYSMSLCSITTKLFITFPTTDLSPSPYLVLGLLRPVMNTTKQNTSIIQFLQ